MQKARKIGIITFFFLIIAGLILIPFIDGLLFKKCYFNFIEAVNKENRVKIEVLDYQTGWLNSNAKLRITRKTPSFLSDFQGPTTLMVENHISHGPFVTDKLKNSLTFAQAGIQTTLVQGVKEGNLDMFTLVLFGGRWVTHFEAPQFVFADNNSKLSWQGLTGEIQSTIHDRSIEAFHLKLQAKSFAAQFIAQPNYVAEVALQNLTYENEATRAANQLWTGWSNLLLPTFQVNLVNGGSASADDLQIHTAASETNNLYGVSLQASIKSLHIPNAVTPTLSPIKFGLSLNNLNPQGLKELINVMKTQSFKNANGVVLPFAYREILPHLITPTTNSNLNVLITTPLGSLQINGKVNWTVPAAMMNDLLQSKPGSTIIIRAAIPLVNSLMTHYLESVKVNAPTQTQPQMTQLQNQFNQQVAQLLQNNQITLPQSLQIIGYSDQAVSQAVFVTNVDQLKLQPAVATQLKQQYQSIQAAKEAAKSATTMLSNQPLTQEQMRALMIKQVIEGWIQQGYLVKDNNDYVMTLTNEKGALMINGKPLSGALPRAPLAQ